MTTARELMSADVVCARSSDTVLQAARTMAETGVGALPICGEDGKLKGMLTDRDIVVKVVAQRNDPIGVMAGELAEGVPFVVQAGDDVTEVLTAMAEHRVRRIPVLEDKKLVGIIAQADVARALGHDSSGRVVEAVSED
ncbi:CBS domain-containing protein [Nocardia terpenica]|uniref:Histidine kinase n=1 Tax=Nocardia terpenica TaxID=455432 RepID=A0A164IZR8_9NOCA|nr:CBS domain-containing protein [Nocardia terpenica]KZM69897.1 histidine kinase [Nocardia terpenica]MBF6065988.1 CBS domain-containing protein [Nocardia terpenica]MBF6108816.1 CBS domain-containing protein [Nocardia terpenica]MBF6116232.1 CBS domain-containing protein [Nocardia terpenica]MBF6123233.1 CBS domain-containing protein [Nocardia terpenica]